MVLWLSSWTKPSSVSMEPKIEASIPTAEKMDLSIYATVDFPLVPVIPTICSPLSGFPYTAGATIAMARRTLDTTSAGVNGDTASNSEGTPSSAPTPSHIYAAAPSSMAPPRNAGRNAAPLHTNRLPDSTMRESMAMPETTREGSPTIRTEMSCASKASANCSSVNRGNAVEHLSEGARESLGMVSPHYANAGGVDATSARSFSPIVCG